MSLQKRLVEAWDNMPVGGKERMKKLGHKPQHMYYIFDNPNYKNVAKMELLLTAIKQVSKDIAKDVEEKNNKVQKA